MLDRAMYVRAARAKAIYFYSHDRLSHNRLIASVSSWYRCGVLPVHRYPYAPFCLGLRYTRDGALDVAVKLAAALDRVSRVSHV